MKIIIIAAVAKNNIIGSNGKIPWHSKEDLQHFKSVTTPHPVVMGRKTYESLAAPLSGRTNFVLTRDKSFSINNVNVFHNVNSLLNFCSEKKYQKVFIIGGGEIYKQFIEIADELMISKFDIEVDGDTYFPKIDKNCWKEIFVKKYDQFTIYRHEKIV